MWMHRDMTVLPFSQDPECWQIWQNPAAILQAPRAVSEMELQELRFLAVSVQRFLDRVRTGKGDFVEISLFGNAVWLCGTMSAFEQYGYHYPKKRSEMGASLYFL